MQELAIALRWGSIGLVAGVLLSRKMYWNTVGAIGFALYVTSAVLVAVFGDAHPAFIFIAITVSVAGILVCVSPMKRLANKKGPGDEELWPEEFLPGEPRPPENLQVPLGSPRRHSPDDLHDDTQ